MGGIFIVPNHELIELPWELTPRVNEAGNPVSRIVAQLPLLVVLSFWRNNMTAALCMYAGPLFPLIETGSEAVPISVGFNELCFLSLIFFFFGLVNALPVLPPFSSHLCNRRQRFKPRRPEHAREICRGLSDSR